MARLLHLISSNQRRGAETFASELAPELARRGHQVEILAVRPSVDGPHLDVTVAGRQRFDPLAFSRIVAAARRSDLIVSFGSITLQLAATAGLVARRPFVYRNIGDPGAWQSVPLSQVRVGAPLRRAVRVVAVFPAARDELVRRYGLDPGIVVPIPRGVDGDGFPIVDDRARRDARRALGLPAGRRWVAFVGSLSEEKDPVAALAAVARMPEDVGLVMCGGGPLLEAVRRQRLLAADRVRIAGPVDDVRPWLAAADVLLLTSRTEGVPGVAIEAGLSGLPVVASNVGGLPYLVEEGRTGFLVPAGDIDRYASALTDAFERRDELGRSAADRCRSVFSMDAVGAAWDQLIGEAMTGSR